MAAPEPLRPMVRPSDVNRQYKYGIMQGADPMDPEVKAKLVTAFTGTIQVFTEAEQAFREGAAEAYTERYKAKLDAEAAIGKALADYAMATAVGAKAKADFAAAAMEAQARLTAMYDFREGNTALTGAFITEAAAFGQEASTAATALMKEESLQQLVAKNGGAFQVNPDGTMAVNPRLDAIIANGVTPIAAMAHERARADYNKDQLNTSRYGTYLNEGAAAASNIADNYAGSFDMAKMLSADGKPPTPEQEAALRDYIRTRAQKETLSTFQADPDFEFGRQQYEKLQVAAEASATELDQVRDSLGASTVGRSDVLGAFKKLANATEETPRDISEGMRTMDVPASITAGRDWAADALSRLEQTPQSPFAVALSKLTQNPNFKVFADAYNFKDTVDAGIYIANHPEEYQAAMAAMDEAKAAGRPLTVEAVKAMQAEGRTLGENATTRWQRLVDTFLAPNRGPGAVALPVISPVEGPPSIAERETAINQGLDATAWGRNPQTRGNQPFPADATRPTEETPAKPAGPPQQEIWDSGTTRRTGKQIAAEAAAAGPGVVDAPKMTQQTVPTAQVQPVAGSNMAQVKANIQALKTRSARNAGIFSPDEG